MTTALVSYTGALQGTARHFPLLVSVGASELQRWHFRHSPSSICRVPVFLLCKWSSMPKPDLELTYGFVSTPAIPFPFGDLKVTTEILCSN